MFSLKLRQTSFYPMIRYQAFSVSDFLGAVGGLLGLIAGISVISIIELALTILKCFGCSFWSKVDPSLENIPKLQKRFLINREHLFYHFGRNFVEFLKESSIHGVHFTNDRKLKAWERLCWLVIICISVTFCSILITDSLNHLQSNSVAIALGEKIWSVEEVRNV